VQGDPLRHERADGQDGYPLPSHVVERSTDERTADSLPLEPRVHLGVGEHDQPVGLLVGGEAERLTFAVYLVTFAVGYVDDVYGGLWGRHSPTVAGHAPGGIPRRERPPSTLRACEKMSR